MSSDNDLSPSAAPEEGFASLGLDPDILEALVRLGYEEPTPIQRAAIPEMIAGHDVLGRAATGTGKTAAFALPVLSKLAGVSDDDRSFPSALILVPTRELAMQVSEAVHRYGRGVGVRVLPIFGGQPIWRQLQSLERGVDVVVATPGRAMDHLRRGTLATHRLATVVLDEADEMLDMGFAEDIETILAETPSTRQTVLFSATMPGRIARLAKAHLNDPVQIEINAEAPDPGTAPRVRQRAYVVPRSHKAAALGRILDIEAPAAAIVFCRTRLEVDSLTETLNGRGYRAEGLHGGMSQEQRDRVMGRLRSGTAELLIATDVAARGLDVDTLTHVVNYDVPSAPETYVHRIGRVGRAGRDGVAITLAGPREHRLLKNIERLTGQNLEIDRIPTAEDLRTRRLEVTTAALRDVALEGDVEPYRVVLDALGDDMDPVVVALAAIKLAHEATNPAADGDDEIPDLSQPRERDSRGRGQKGAKGTDDRRGDRKKDDWKKQGHKKGDRTKDGPRGDGKGKHGGPRPVAPGQARMYIGAGRSEGVRPKDLVGAITGESNVSGKDVGVVRIGDHYSLVDVPDRVADEVMWSLRRTKIRGVKPKVRRDRDKPAGRD